MTRAFEQFAAWRLASPLPRSFMSRPKLENDARERWDGEGGNSGLAHSRNQDKRQAMRASAPTGALGLPTMGRPRKAE